MKVPKKSPEIRGELLSIREAAEYISLSYETIRQLVKNNKISYRNPTGGKVLIDSAELDDLLKNTLISPRGV
jgi:excisionase family DNA binding protein